MKARNIAAALLTIAILAGGITSASAEQSAVSRGTKYCATGTTGWTQGRLKGTTTLVKGAGKSTYTSWQTSSSTTWYTRVAQGASGGGAWGVVGSNGVDGSLTYAYCTQYS